MRQIMAVHYVPKPGGGVAVPGEIFEPEAAERFTNTQVEWLVKAGAIQVKDLPDVTKATTEFTDMRYAPETPQAAAEAEPEDVEEDDGPEPEPPEIDALDGIVQAEEAPEEPQKKLKAGRRKTK